MTCMVNSTAVLDLDDSLMSDVAESMDLDAPSMKMRPKKCGGPQKSFDNSTYTSIGAVLNDYGVNF